MIEQIEDLLEGARFKISTINPSEWYEKHRVMSGGVSNFKGKFSYDITPYCREIVDCASPFSPVRRIAFMKAAQIGVTTGVIEPSIAWAIAENPTNILFLTGHSDLAEEAMNKVDFAIDSCGLRHLIKPQAQRAKTMKTGDTNMKKEFAGGELIAGSAGNHKLLRQRSIGMAFIDDFDAAKNATNESGDTRQMIEQRLASYWDKMKIFYISTPELRESSNIEPIYLLGDQRKYNVPCPCCGEFIELKWTIQIGEESAGIVWKTDNLGRVIRDSVGYVCQKCAGFFKDKHKYEMNINGIWQPTCEAVLADTRSYHLSALYAPSGMKGWADYVEQYVEANPKEGTIESLYKTFVNLCEGLPYEPKTKELSAGNLQNNIRPYEVGEIPEKLSINDGNGKIVLITCACDMNGTIDDARLDYEVVAWSAKGASYSVLHGSIGTFKPSHLRTKDYDNGRDKYTYEFGQRNSVWNEFVNILNKKYVTDTGRQMGIFISGVDTGHYTMYANEFVEKYNGNIGMVWGLKGQDDEHYSRFALDVKTFSYSREKNNLCLVQSNAIKDLLSDYIGLNWKKNEEQPSNFMNFPNPNNNLYGWSNFFQHFEAEERILTTSKAGISRIMWRKKNAQAQNHLFDCRIYNLALRDIFISQFGREMKIAKPTWADYVNSLGKLAYG